MPSLHPPLLLALALMATPARADTVAVSPKPPSITVARAARDTIVETAIVTGTLVARDEVLVNTQVDGLAVTEIDAEEGDRVTRGQVLARLSRDALDASLAQNTAQVARAGAAVTQAQGSIAEAQATRAQADAAFARTKTLVETGTASRDTYDQRQAVALTGAARLASADAARKVAEADLALAEAQRRETAVRVDRTEIRAPVAGIVSRRTARLGAVINMAGEPLFRLIGDGAVELEADVPEAQLVRLRPNQPVRLYVAGDDAPHPGHVRLVAPEVSRTTRLGRVRVAFEGGFAPTIGGFARASVEVARHVGLVVPLSAVLFRPEGPRAQVVVDGVVHTRPVTVGLRADRRAEIVAGVAEGDQLVAVSGTFVRDGDRVTPVDPSTLAAAP